MSARDNTEIEQQDQDPDVWCHRHWVTQGLRPEICGGCIARQQHSNCWQVAVSPCCKRSRTECAHCAVYISYQSSCGAKHEVEIRLADGMWLVGEIYVPPDKRLSELVNDPQRMFLTITNVTEDPGHACNSTASQVLMLNKRTIQSIQPVGGASGAAPIDTYLPKYIGEPPAQEVA